MLLSLGLWIGFQVSHSLFAGVIGKLCISGFVVSFFKRDGIVVGTFFALVSGLFTWLAYYSMPICFFLILCIDLILVPISLGCVVAAILFDSPA